jgi:putative peptide zinc metalloprotease protein
MLCRVCRRQRPGDERPCPSCGASRGGLPPALDLVLAGGTRVALVGTLTIGRALDCDIRLDDPSVSRHHARVTTTASATILEDTRSSHGTSVNGTRLEGGSHALGDGDRVRIGDTQLTVERPRGEAEPGRTIVVPPGASLLLQRAGPAQLESDAAEFGGRPRVRSGWALKRLDATEGDRRYMLADLAGGQYLRMGEAEAELFQLMDGTCTLPELIAEAEERLGPAGPGRLARLLSGLADRGMLEGVEGTDQAGRPPGWRGLLTPRELVIGDAGSWFETVYRRGGFILYARAALALAAAVAVAGLAAFGWLIAGGATTPLVVNHSLGLGSLAFLAGRFLVVALHECAHGLTMASFGRRARRAGLKLMLIFPYAFVDTSEAWFEPRRRRIAVSLAGPASDLTVGGACALAAAAGGMSVREVGFQIALGAYLGVLLNLNPFLDRDGYHVLVDLAGQPGLRKRARERLARRLEGVPVEPAGSRLLEVYAVAGAVWLLVAAAFGILMSVRYYGVMVEVAHSRLVANVIVAALALVLSTPVLVTVGRPLVRRMRRVRGTADGG